MTVACAVGLLCGTARSTQAQFWGFNLPRPRSLTSAPTPPLAESHVPHPAVVRVIVDERNSLSHGTGVLVGVHEQHALVLTNWHVVRDVAGPINVIFPSGFVSTAKIAKVDRDWDLAALGIWNPNTSPIPIAKNPPRVGEPLTIAGYGSGQYRAVTGRCSQFLSPGDRFPYEMVEVTVEARRGDSGGPILNQQGELAGVLFGASRGTTSGSHSGRVRRFLAPWIAIVDHPPPIRADAQMATQPAPTQPPHPTGDVASTTITAPHPPATAAAPSHPFAMPASTGPLPTGSQESMRQLSSLAGGIEMHPVPGANHLPPISAGNAATSFGPAGSGRLVDTTPLPWTSPTADSPAGSRAAETPKGATLVEHGRNVLAIVGAIAVVFALFGRSSRKADDDADEYE